MELYSPHVDKSYQFINVSIIFDERIDKNVFSRKNNKTLSETLTHKNYVKFSPEITNKYSQYLSRPLGEFLLILKRSEDYFYRRFLNKHGDENYVYFKISDVCFHNLKGIYAYCVDGDLKYIGRCRDSMKKRINGGYGRITPKNCYIDGQSTNCHVNSLIAKEKGVVTLWLYSMECDTDIVSTERLLIEEFNPAWNKK